MLLAVRDCLSLAPGRLADQNPLEAVVLPRLTGKALVAPLSMESHCAVVTLQLPTSSLDTRPSPERFEFSFSHG